MGTRFFVFSLVEQLDVLTIDDDAVRRAFPRDDDRIAVSGYSLNIKRCEGHIDVGIGISRGGRHLEDHFLLFLSLFLTLHRLGGDTLDELTSLVVGVFDDG